MTGIPKTVLAKEFSVNINTFNGRLARGWTIYDALTVPEKGVEPLTIDIKDIHKSIASVIGEKHHGKRITKANLENIFLVELDKFYDKIVKRVKINTYRQVRSILLKLEAME